MGKGAFSPSLHKIQVKPNTPKVWKFGSTQRSCKWLMAFLGGQGTVARFLPETVWAAAMNLREPGKEGQSECSVVLPEHLWMLGKRPGPQKSRGEGGVDLR